MTEFPDGPLWKHKQDLQGHQYPKNLKSAKKAQRDVTGNIEKSLLLYMKIMLMMMTSIWPNKKFH